MNIFVKSHFQISQFISDNKDKLSEVELASIVENYADTEVVSESAVDHLMLQAKPMTTLGEYMIEKYGGLEAAYAMIPAIVEAFKSRNANKSIND